MPELTHSSMSDARDAEDNRLLQSGEIDLLLSGWVETITGRCVAKMRGPVGHDVAQAVCERLWRELKTGKHRDGRWPFRVIVHKVIGFMCAGWYEKGWGELEWIEIDGPDDDFTGEVELQLTLEAFVATLSRTTRTDSGSTRIPTKTAASATSTSNAQSQRSRARSVNTREALTAELVRAPVHGCRVYHPVRG